jgi:hypothetical protein
MRHRNDCGNQKLIIFRRYSGFGDKLGLMKNQVVKAERSSTFKVFGLKRLTIRVLGLMAFILHFLSSLPPPQKLAPSA